RALQDRLRELRVVSAFSRLHPLLPQRAFLTGFGACVGRGRTVSIDLALPGDVQRAGYRGNHLSGIRKLVRKGITVVRDPDRKYMEAFQQIYDETMRRVGAGPSYFFPRSFFARLSDALGP